MLDRRLSYSIDDALRSRTWRLQTDGFLDKTWFNRTYWTHSQRWPGYYFTYRGPKSGQILVFNDAATYAVKVYRARRGHSPEFAPGSGYQLMADRNATKPVLDVMDIGAEKGRGFTRTELPIWSEKMWMRLCLGCWITTMQKSRSQILCSLRRKPSLVILSR